MWQVNLVLVVVVFWNMKVTYWMFLKDYARFRVHVVTIIIGKTMWTVKAAIPARILTGLF